MADDFDPYRQWLSIPAQHQPPHLYRLLGLVEFEDDTDAIAAAVDRHMMHIRTYQTGKYADHSQRILNELAAAKLTLLDPKKKRAYDAKLRKKLHTATSAVAAAPAPRTTPAQEVALPPPAAKPAPRVSGSKSGIGVASTAATIGWDWGIMRRAITSATSR